MSNTTAATVVPGKQVCSTSRYLLLALTVVAAATNITSCMKVSSGALPHAMGLRNEEPMMFYGAVWLGTWLVSLLFLSVSSIVLRQTARGVAIGALLVCIVAVPARCSLRPLPRDPYVFGFQQWVRKNVQRETIARWSESLPVVQKHTVVPSNQWPPEVARLKPLKVQQRAEGKGVVLEWGYLGTWGTSRLVYVGPTDRPLWPPDDVDLRHQWVSISPGLFASVQISD